jgi:hypothetical protein
MLHSDSETVFLEGGGLKFSLLVTNLLFSDVGQGHSSEFSWVLLVRRGFLGGAAAQPVSCVHQSWLSANVGLGDRSRWLFSAPVD